MDNKVEFDFEEVYDSGVKIKVIGVGGGGNNAIDRMVSANIRGVEFIAINTDAQVLRNSCATKKLVIGEKITHGKGAGANPDVGRRAAEESIEDIRRLLSGADMVFITAGMGGGTGTGAAPIVARVAKEMNILTVGIVTKPFAFEGRVRYTLAEQGIVEIAKYVDSLIVIPNERLKQVEDTKITLANAFEIADNVLRRGVQSVAEIINGNGFINLDFADVTTIMKNAGYAHMGVGSAKNIEDKASIAAQASICSPLLETTISGAKGVLVSIRASMDITLEEAEIASTIIREEAAEDATIIWGVTFDPDLHEEIRVTIIATGFDDAKKQMIRTTGVVTPTIPTPVEKPVYTEPEPKEIPSDLAVGETVIEEIKVPQIKPETEFVFDDIEEDPAPNTQGEIDDIFTFIKRKCKNQ